MTKRRYLSLLIIISLFLTGVLISLNISAQNDVPCAYVYGDWGVCNSFGIKTRSYTATPGGCYIVDYPVTSQYCCNYVYTDWSSCDSSGIQRRYVSSATAYGCNELVAPVLEQTCTYISSSTPCTYTYGDWSSCSSAGIKTRNYTASPSGCYMYPSPETQQTCCNYVYSDWFSCNASGTQSRTVVSYSPSGCIDYVGPILHQNCTITNTTTACSYIIYSDWSTCSSTGVQTRTIYKSPAGCHATTTPILEQKCTYTGTTSAPTTTCENQCGEWSLCGTAGVQTRTCYQTPSGCVPSPNYPMITQQTCTVTTTTIGTATTSSSITPTTTQAVTCDYKYGEWSTCNSNGVKTRTYTKIPEGCVINKNYPPIVEQACPTSTINSTTVTPSESESSSSSVNVYKIPCVYAYSQWNDCSSLGTEKRMLISKSPNDCYQSDAPFLEQSCVYTPVQTIVGETSAGTNATSIAANITTPCVYDYSAWGECVSGKKTRMVISKLPSDCYESSAPDLTQSCKTPLSIASMPIDMPAPAPQSVLTDLGTTSEANLNGRTSSEWQKHYFGSPDCSNPKICAGSADPDNDGLNNNEEYRFGTNPKDPDTDHDGHVDGEEIQNGHNPLVAESKTISDAMVFESPIKKGEVKKDKFKVDSVEPLSTKDINKGLKISGKALPNTYVTLFIYSDPIVLAIKTDSDGNWSYVLDKPIENGKHEVYVAVTDNTGKITAKSEPIAFVKTAEAMEIAPFPTVTKPNPEVSPTKSWLEGGYFIFILIGLSGLLLAILTLGLIAHSVGKKTDDANN